MITKFQIQLRSKTNPSWHDFGDTTWDDMISAEKAAALAGLEESGDVFEWRILPVAFATPAEYDPDTAQKARDGLDDISYAIALLATAAESEKWEASERIQKLKNAFGEFRRGVLALLGLERL